MNGKPDTELFMGATEAERGTFLGHLSGYDSPGWMRRKDSALLLADFQVYEIIGSGLPRDRQRRAYDYAHELRREIGRRKLVPLPSRKIPRCEVCSHGTERLFRTSEHTHDITDRNDKKILPNLCVRCWSRLHIDSKESE